MLNIHPVHLDELRAFARRWHEGVCYGHSAMAGLLSFGQLGTHVSGGRPSRKREERVSKELDRAEAYLMRFLEGTHGCTPLERGRKMRLLQVAFGDEDAQGLDACLRRPAVEPGWDRIPCVRRADVAEKDHCRACRRSHPSRCETPAREWRDRVAATPKRMGYGTFPRAVLASDAAIRLYDAHHVRPLYAPDEPRALTGWKPELHAWLRQVDAQGAAGDKAQGRLRYRLEAETEAELKALLLAMGYEVNGEERTPLATLPDTVSIRRIAEALRMRREDVGLELDRRKIRAGRRRTPGRPSAIPLSALQERWVEAWRAVREAT